MDWALGASLILNGVLVGAYIGSYLYQRSEGQGQTGVEVIPGGGTAQDPDTDWAYDPTVTSTARKVGFRS